MLSFQEYLQEVKEPTGKLKDACWKGYTAVGMKMKNWKKVPNCVPKNEEVDRLAFESAGGNADPKKRFYSVVRGHNPGVYHTWNEAKIQVDGYIGAVYKSFKTEEEARNWAPTANGVRIYLNVPFDEKDIVKAQGAKWDPEEKKWWVQEMKPILKKYNS